MKTVNRKVGYLILIVGLVACSAKSVKNSEEKDTDSVSIEVPSFDTDSAYAYIERQVQFGFRVPNTPAHLATADYLSSELARHGAVVEVQQGTVTAYDGTELSIRNIIGSFSPEKKNRSLIGILVHTPITTRIRVNIVSLSPEPTTVRAEWAYCLK